MIEAIIKKVGDEFYNVEVTDSKGETIMSAYVDEIKVKKIETCNQYAITIIKNRIWVYVDNYEVV